MLYDLLNVFFINDVIIKLIRLVSRRLIQPKAVFEVLLHDARGNMNEIFLTSKK